MNNLTKTIKESREDFDKNFSLSEFTTDRAYKLNKEHNTQTTKKIIEKIMEEVEWKEDLSELLRLEKKRDDEYEKASILHKNHQSEETLSKMKSFENPNDTYNSGMRQGKVEIINKIQKLLRETLNKL